MKLGAPRPKLPVALRRGAFASLDRQTTVIAAFSFLFHFGVVSALYSDIADPTVDDDGVRVARVLGILRDLGPPPPLETHPDGRKIRASYGPRDLPEPMPPGVVTCHGGPASPDRHEVLIGPPMPIPSLSMAPPSVDTGRVPDADRVVAGMKSLLRACYRRELDRDPTARGSVQVAAKIGPTGEVTSVQAAKSGLSPTLVACLSRVVRGAQFGPPEGGSARVTIPMTFTPG